VPKGYDKSLLNKVVKYAEKKKIKVKINEL